VADFKKEDLDKFAEAVRLLKLYRRADMESADGKDLIEQLYVDPLPHEHVLHQIRQPTTTFIVGRKGTGKSTIFLRARKSLLAQKEVIATYVDIKTVWESSRVDPALAAAAAAAGGALSDGARDQLLLLTAFLRAVVSGVRDDLQAQLKSSWKTRLREVVTGEYSDLESKLTAFLDDLERPTFVNIQGVRAEGITEKERTSSSQEAKAKLSLSPSSLNGGLEVGGSDTRESESTAAYSDVLLRTIDIRNLISGLKAILEPLNIKHLYVFLDDFSELPEQAMQTVVNVLIAPLNNWSEELVKFKVAAYPGRIYYGSLDKSKIDEVTLDLHSIYGQSGVAAMEEKSSEFTQRLVERRLEYFGLEPSKFLDVGRDSQLWNILFQASMGNPRTLGYILFFAYESQLLYGRRISNRGVRDASQRYYEEKLEPYFAMGAFLHEAFDERSTIFSLKELLEKIVSQARSLKPKERGTVFKGIEGRPPASHFNVSPAFESLLSTLELNFFVTKYFEMSNRDAKLVSIYALNYGLCEKYNIAFGRPTQTREHRLYFVERAFDYNTIMQAYVSTNQEIQCDSCGFIFDSSELESLKKYRMLCPSCRVGTCVVTNIAKKYSDLVSRVASEQLLPETELGILRSLDSESRPLYPGEIAGELDVSHQLIGSRAKRLDEQNLIVRKAARSGRRTYALTTDAKRIYFDDRAAWGLQVTADDSDGSHQ
jgi:DNA-binding MarR family transcriptional regulator